MNVTIFILGEIQKNMKNKLHKIKMNLLTNITNPNNILFHIIGLICIIWFLTRVIPKPDRIRYPCQQISITIAIGYITFWIILWTALYHGLKLWIKKAKYNITKSAPVILVSFLLIFSISSNVFANINNYDEKEKQPLWNPIPKQPIGTPKGVNPGRVVWVWNPNATEKEPIGYWWEKQNNDQKVIDNMFSYGLQKLANTNDDYLAWDHLFKYFNQIHNYGNNGYQTGEKIAIKINLNNRQDYTSEDNYRDASPYVVKSLLRQLVNIVGVNQEDITIYDATRPIANWFYNRVYYKEYPADPPIPEFPDVHYVDNAGGASGREKVIASSERVYFAAGSCEYRTLPTIVADADYLINMPILKRHPIENGVTLSGKNLFGTWIESVESIHPYLYSSFTMGNPAPQTDLLAHKDIGGKTIIYIGDGTYATKTTHRTIEKFQMYPFNNDWTNSLFFSQDPVAIDSVMYDFLQAEGTNPAEGSQNYLHQSAEPPANTYDPEKDGNYLTDSLGVHEHWDTTKDIFSPQRYTGPTNNGIDYITYLFEADANGPYYGLTNTPIQFQGTANGGYPPYHWDWDFGDGTTGTEKDITHIYDEVGDYTVTLTVTDSYGNTCTDTTTVIITTQPPPPQPPPEHPSDNESDDENLPPNANANGPFYGFIDIPTTFDGSNSNDPDGIITKFSWSFGDGTTGTGKVITHIYNNVGNYTVTLTVTDNYGKTGIYTTYAVMIDKPNIPPNKPSIYGNVTGEKNTNYYYNVISIDQDNDNIKYIIDWDDEDNLTVTDFVQNDTSYTVMHSWTNPGAYKIKVSAIDEHNSTSDTEELMVLIDVHYCDDIGYIIDTDSDGIYELFHSNSTGNETDIKTQNGGYLIDSNEDGKWDYNFDLITGLSGYIEEKKIEETPGFELILIICAIMLVFIWKQKKVK